MRNFFSRIVQRTQMRLYNLIISSREGSCPCRARAHALEIVQNLARQRQKSTRCLAALHPKRGEQLSGRFHQGENVPGSQNGGGVIEDFLSRSDLHWRSPERSCNLPCRANSGGI